MFQQFKTCLTAEKNFDNIITLLDWCKETFKCQKASFIFLDKDIK